MPATGHIRRLLLIALIPCVQLALVDTSWADRPKVRCQAALVGRRVLVRISLHEFLDRDLTRLVRLGLDGRIAVATTLMRRRRWWFDDTVAAGSKRLTLSYRRGRGFMVDRRASLASVVRLDLGTLSLGRNLKSNSGLYVEVAAKLRVVTSSSLRKTAGWITESKGDSGMVGDRVIKMVVSDLSRSALASCRVLRR